ncbi:uncharacterized protein LOC130046387 isoform X2 [Ostrea edulis]|nr:uncharacterized protein LOC130046387 isoform X2 [Ostrea edulis]
MFGSRGSEDGISGSEDIHRECLQENLQLMSDNMVLKRVVLLDELVENGCLTENETADILEFEKRKDQTRKLAVTISKRSREKFSLFLEVLKRSENYPYIADQMEESYNIKVEESRRKRECIQCYMVRNVDLRDILDLLCSQFVVDLEFVNDVISCENRNTARMESLWKHLFDILNTSADAGRYRKVFKESLGRKYDHIAVKLSAKNKIRCRCKATEAKKIVRIENMSWPSGSVTTDERSTTSTAIRQKLHPGTLSAFSAISESVSDVSNDGLSCNIPRTIEWLESVQTEQEEFPICECKSDISNSMDHDHSDIPLIALPKERSRSLAAIGDGLLMEAGIEASIEEQHKRSLYVDSGNALDTTAQVHMETVQTGASKKERKSAKKKKKKRKRTQSEPVAKLQEEENEVDSKMMSRSLSQGSVQTKRTIGDRLFINIPTIDNTEDCAIKPCCETSTENRSQMDPKVLTPPRQVSSLTKVGCCNKRGNNKKKKMKHS